MPAGLVLLSQAPLLFEHAYWLRAAANRMIVGGSHKSGASLTDVQLHQTCLLINLHILLLRKNGYVIAISWHHVCYFRAISCLDMSKCVGISP